MRSLLGMLAVTSLVLAVVLRQQYLIIAAALLVAITVFLVVQRGLRHRKANRNRERVVPESAPQDQEEDLETLGIMSITEKRPPPSLPKPNPIALQPDGTETPTPDAEPSLLPSAAAVIEAGGLPDAYHADVLSPVLEGIRAALGSDVVCILRQHPEDQYVVVGTAGDNFVKQAGESFDTPAPILLEGEEMAIKAVPDDLTPRALKYTRTPGSVERIVAARVPDTPLILLAHTTVPRGLSHRMTRNLVHLYTEIIRVLFQQENPARKVHEQISHQMVLARAAKRDLTLALVTPVNYDQLVELGDGVVKEVGFKLKSRLVSAWKECTVISTGPLMAGVFLYQDASGAARWHKQVKSSFDEEKGVLGGPMAVGAAVWRDSEADVEADGKVLYRTAQGALEEAYIQGGGIVIDDPRDHQPQTSGTN